MKTEYPRLDQRKFSIQIKPYAKTIMTGSMLAVDPGSQSMGWAWFTQGNLVISGEYKARPGAPHRRLIEIAEQLSEWTKPDILVIEKMYKFNPPLIWSVGTAITVTKPELMLEIPIKLWKDLIDDQYTKTDRNDAILLGKVAIHYAKEYI
jgi:hypothetical protein